MSTVGGYVENLSVAKIQNLSTALREVDRTPIAMIWRF